MPKLTKQNVVLAIFRAADRPLSATDVICCLSDAVGEIEVRIALANLTTAKLLTTYETPSGITKYVFDADL